MKTVEIEARNWTEALQIVKKKYRRFYYYIGGKTIEKGRLYMVNLENRKKRPKRIEMKKIYIEAYNFREAKLRVLKQHPDLVFVKGRVLEKPKILKNYEIIMRTRISNLRPLHFYS